MKSDSTGLKKPVLFLSVEKRICFSNRKRLENRDLLNIFNCSGGLQTSMVWEGEEWKAEAALRWCPHQRRIIVQ